MTGRYSVDDLLRLRASPLIEKPANIAEIQATINTPAAQETTKRFPARPTKLDDVLSPTEAFQKRPFDATSRKSATDPERIVLGPPRRSFASSTVRTNGKDGEDSSREKDTQYEKLKSSDRFRHARDQDPNDKNLRRRTDDHDERPRKPKWATEDGDDTRRDSRPSKKFEQTWSRWDRSTHENAKDGDNEWQRGGGRGWQQRDREPQNDYQPEWLDGDDDGADDNPMGKTQADFELWIKRQKAKDLGIELQDEPPPEPAPAPEQSIKKAPQFYDGEDATMDKFFARATEKAADSTAPKPAAKSRFFGAAPINTQPSAATNPTNPTPTPQQASAPALKPVSAGPNPVQQMFGLSIREKMSPSPAAIAAAGPKSAGAVDADAAGFARIMDMLGARKTNGSSSSQGPPQPTQPAQPQSPQQPTTQSRENRGRVPLYARDSQSRAETPQDNSSPLLALLNGQGPPRQQDTPQRRSTAHERFDASRSPLEPVHGRSVSTKDQSLLNLLKQADQAPKPTPDPEMHPHRASDYNNRMAMARNEIPPGLDMHRGYPQAPPEEHTRFRYPDDERSRAMYDDYVADRILGASSKNGQSHGHGLPPTLPLGRPPGFDSGRMPPPGYGPQMSQQPRPQQQHNMQQGGGRPQGPPGLSNPGRPNIPPGYGLPPQQSLDPRSQPQNGHPPGGPQRKYTGSDASLPPMMGAPPPGFHGHNGNGPQGPPGLMGMLGGAAQQQQQRASYPAPGMHGAPDHQGPPGRQFMDMYGSGDMPPLSGPASNGPGSGPTPRQTGVRGGAPGYR
ncbi:uncharacterized protein AB675_4736 [Cyphellophora attinorum]|uniref:Uncharacterized protein n=1 Tax=Cyphellophora attinorum TaxID=1664694 RepID=A0A0N1NYM5_9EURO|nr:uncharacterized protein AB675_4736 [Phialophora attinorum]KPI39165.1 hypothetical protein AB675_4736 [Phialophora attinorum]